MMNVLLCTKCGHQGPDDDFPNDKRNGKRRCRSSWCRECYREHGRRYKSTMSGEQKKAYNDTYYDKHYDRIREDQKHLRLMSRYGLTMAEYQGLMVSQKYMCAICEKRVERLDVDHCHETGEVRGLLCRGCNMALGVLERRVWVDRALEYLQ